MRGHNYIQPIDSDGPTQENAATVPPPASSSKLFSEDKRKGDETDAKHIFTIEGDPSNMAPAINGSSTNGDAVRNEEVNNVAVLLETPEENRQRKKSHRIIYLTAFIMSMGFTIVFTSIWPYLKQLDSTASKSFYGLVIAINPLGQFLLAPILGIWSKKLNSSRLPFVVSIIIFIAGNFLYSLLRLIRGKAAAYFLLVARFIVGLGSANIALCRSYLASSTTLAERSVVLGYASAAQSLGFILGPAIQTGLAIIIPEEEYPVYNPSLNTTMSLDMPWYRPVWDLYTASGWIAVFVGTINLALFFPCCYSEVNICDREGRLQKKSAKNRVVKFPKPDYFALVIVLINFFIVMAIYTLLETIITPMTKDLYAWTSEFAIRMVGIGMSILGLVAFFVFFVTGLLVTRFDERKLYLFLGLIPLALSMLLHTPMGHHYPIIQNCSSIDNSSVYETDFMSTTTTLPTLAPLRSRREVQFHYLPPSEYLNELSASVVRSKRAAILDDDESCNAVGCPASQAWCLYTPIIELPQLIVGNLIGVIGYPVAFTLSNSLFSKIVGPKNQGPWMGIFTSIGSMSRMLGPIFVTVTYSNLGTRWTFGILTVVMLIAIVFGIVVFKRLVPMDVNKDDTVDAEVVAEQETDLLNV